MKLKPILLEILKESSGMFPSAEEVLGMIDYRDSYKDLYPGYESDNENEYEDEYYFDSKEKALQYAEETVDLFDNLPDPIQVYRSIRVDDESKIDKEDLGESWSFDKSSAIQFGKHAGCNYLLSGLVSKKDVDWESTFKVYTQFSGGYDSDDENEITVPQSDSIKELKISKM